MEAEPETRRAFAPKLGLQKLLGEFAEETNTKQIRIPLIIITIIMIEVLLRGAHQGRFRVPGSSRKEGLIWLKKTLHWKGVPTSTTRETVHQLVLWGGGALLNTIILEAARDQLNI